MGQDLIFEWLKLQRRTGEEKYFTVRDIQKAMREKGLPCGVNVYRLVNRLYASGCLEVKIRSKVVWQRYQSRAFRIKKEYLCEKCEFENLVRVYQKYDVEVE